MIDTRLAQIVVFEKSGRYIDSCHTIFNSINWENKSIYQLEPWLEGMRPCIEELDLFQAPIYLPAVERKINDKKRYFDYHLFNLEENEDILVWLLIDMTSAYEEMIQVQQVRNEYRVKLESLSH